MIPFYLNPQNLKPETINPKTVLNTNMVIYETVRLCLVIIYDTI